ncbi:MAG: hypothetical protein FWD17_04920, partial [Polyangiaceae bacterium]|nr:hypothetical protein [Polyangiaceae bacterium]
MRESTHQVTSALAAPDAGTLTGSDTLFDWTQSTIASCPGASGLAYVGGGSEIGEANLDAGTQSVAPMSTFFDRGACAGGHAATAEGLVVGLDGITVVGSTAAAGTPACNGALADCDPTTDPGTGAAFDTTVQRPTLGPYTFHGWRDVLEVLFTGTVDPNLGHGTDPEVGKNCNSEIRRTLADNYGAFFENPSCATGSPCRQIQHVFRPDDASGTAQVFLSLLGGPSPDALANPVNPLIGVLPSDGGTKPTSYPLGTDSFCNDYQNQSGDFKTVWPGNNPPSQYTANVFYQFDSNGNGVVGSQDAGNAGIVPNDDQDLDPIRRPCEGNGVANGTSAVPNPTEQVCERGTFDIANTTVVHLGDGGVTYNCGANDAGACPGNEICYGPGQPGTSGLQLVDAGAGQCWGSVDTTASQTSVSGKQSCAAGGGAGSCPFGEPCLLTDGGVPEAGVPAQCWAKPSQGSLGLVLPIVDSTVLATQDDPNNTSIDIQYNVTTAPSPTPGEMNVCTTNTEVKPPFVSRYSPSGVPARGTGLCPNGDISTPAGGLCTVPADADGNPNCLTLAGASLVEQAECAAGGPLGGGQGTLDGTACSGYGPDPAKTDPRVYNLYAWRNTGTCTGHNPATGACNAWSGNWVMATDGSSVAATNRPLFGGAYYRIHTSQTMQVPNTGPFDGTGSTHPTTCHQGATQLNADGTVNTVACPVVCASTSATDQMGCLVAASPCSFGLAGRQASTEPGAVAVKIEGLDPTPSCIQSMAYPLWRKLYLDTEIGFANVSGAPLALAQCEADAGTVGPTLTASGFVPLPAGAPGNGAPYCEDFDEATACGAASNANACASNGAVGLPAVSTTCGNGVVEAFEECDQGSANGPPPAPCSALCRNNAITVPQWPAQSSLTASAVDTTSVQLTWTAATDSTGVSQYGVYENGQLVAVVSGSATTYTATGLTAGQPYTFGVQADDASGAVTTNGPETTYTPQTPDPSQVAPPIEPSIATTVANSVGFLVSGPNPIQTGFTATLDPPRVVTVAGRVLDADGNPLSGAIVTVADHPEYGQTLSRADGKYDLVLNGGGAVTLAFNMTGRMQAERTLAAGWQDRLHLPDVALIAADTQSTLANFSGGASLAVARASAVHDADGDRQATLMVAAGTTATMTLANGQTQDLTAGHVRATEFTVGAQGPAAMPGTLPATTGYTYAVALTIDEAQSAGATQVTFSTPIGFYLENFLGLNVGVRVPAGFYDEVAHRWVASTDGLCVRVLTTSGGLATLDVDGSNQPASAAALSALGITNDELVTIAQLYAANETLWRVPVSHFTAWDFNLGTAPTAGAVPPNAESDGGTDSDGGPAPAGSPNADPSPPDGQQTSCPDQAKGCIIEVENRTLGEQIAVKGTPYTLNYRSDRQSGYLSNRLTIPLTNANPPPG